MFLDPLFQPFHKLPTSIFLYVEARHPAHSSLRKESPAELMLLTVVWGKTASGTARSKTEVELHR